MQTGTVKWFDERKGYGFVELDTNAPDVFVHWRDIEMDGYKVLKEGEAVTFEIEERADGRLRATSVRRMAEQPETC